MNINLKGIERLLYILDPSVSQFEEYDNNVLLKKNGNTSLNLELKSASLRTLMHLYTRGLYP